MQSSTPTISPLLLTPRQAAEALAISDWRRDALAPIAPDAGQV
jgi:hypothetical protein